MAMIQSRNQTPHAYNREVADEIAKKLTDVYHNLFVAFERRIQNLIDTD
jgi:hypothetical protein